jgi:lipoprotein-releasing system permease protein
MSFKLIWEIAKALLLARLRQTVVAGVGVTFSITMFIALLSFMGGLNKLLDGLVINRTPHIRLYKEIAAAGHQPVDLEYKYRQGYNFISSIKPRNDLPEIHNSLAIMKTVAADRRVQGICPHITAQIFYNAGQIRLTGLINGIDGVSENNFFSFGDYVIAGRLADLANVPNSIILGKGIAEKVLAHIGDIIHVTTGNGEDVPLKVVGFYQSGLQEIDDVQSYASIATTQKLLGQSNNYITDIYIKLNDINQAPAMADYYRQLFEIDAMDIQTANSQFDTGSFIRSLISYAVGVTLLVVAGFGIYNILNMMIYEKLDSIAILKATGFSGKDVSRIFNSIALSIGIFGGLLGLLLGFVLSVVIHQIPFNTPALPTIKTYPIDFNPRFYFTGGVFSLLTTYFAGYFPARKAGKVDPVVIIRGK